MISAIDNSNTRHELRPGRVRTHARHLPPSRARACPGLNASKGRSNSKEITYVLAHAWIPIPEVAESLASVVTAQPASSSPTNSLASRGPECDDQQSQANWILRLARCARSTITPGIAWGLETHATRPVSLSRQASLPSARRDEICDRSGNLFSTFSKVASSIIRRPSTSSSRFPASQQAAPTQGSGDSPGLL